MLFQEVAGFGYNAVTDRAQLQNVQKMGAKTVREERAIRSEGQEVNLARTRKGKPNQDKKE